MRSYAGLGATRATQNRQVLANQTSLDEVNKALALTETLFKPGNLQPGLQDYLQPPPR